MREIRPSGSEGGGTLIGSPYPYQDVARWAGFAATADIKLAPMDRGCRNLRQQSGVFYPISASS